jgi:hypothetical protein
MKRRSLLGLAMLAAVLLAGCAPSIVVQNKTSFGVRAIVTSGAGTEVLSPSPGESSTADGAEGSYTVSAIPEQEWLDWATATRKYLNDQLKDSSKLTGQQLLDLIDRLKSIATKMKQFQDAAASSGSYCTGVLSSDANGNAVIATKPGGGLVVSCGTLSASPN